jgi:hypothetical protein
MTSAELGRIVKENKYFPLLRFFTNIDCLVQQSTAIRDKAIKSTGKYGLLLLLPQFSDM